MPNQNPEQKARDTIDAMLRAAGWSVQEKSKIDFNTSGGQAQKKESPSKARASMKHD